MICPFGQTTFRTRGYQPVRHHRQHCMFQNLGTAFRAHFCEEPPKTQLFPYRRCRGYRSHRGCSLGGQAVNVDAFFVEVTFQRGDDPSQLSGFAQSSDFSQTQQGPMADLRPLANRFHQRQVLVHLVAPPTPGRLNEHTPQYYHHTPHNTNKLSPLQYRAEAAPHNTKPQVNTLMASHQTP